MRLVSLPPAVPPLSEARGKCTPDQAAEEETIPQSSTGRLQDTGGGDSGHVTGAAAWLPGRGPAVLRESA